MRLISATTQNGFSLIELLAAMTIAAITMTFVITGMGELLSRGRLESSAQKLYDTLNLARSEAIIRNSNFFVNITEGANWCIGLDDTGTCACGTSNDCTVDGSEKVISATEFSGISLEDNNGLTSFRFDPRNGIPEQTTNAAYTESTYTFSNAAGNELAVVVNSVGRMRLCSGSNPVFRGYAAC